MKGMDTGERRRNERIPLSVPQTVNIRNMTDGYLVGLSYDGAEIATLGQPKPSGVIEIGLNLPQDMYKLTLKGEVVWQRKEKAWHMGIKLMPLSNADKLVLEAYVDYLKRDNSLMETRKKINMHLDSFIKNFEKLLALRDYTVSSLNTLPEKRAIPIDPQSKYLH